MIYDINDSKGRYFMWLCITILLVVGLSTFLFIKATSEEEEIITRVIESLIVAYPIGTLPLGWKVKSTIMEILSGRPSWYVPFPKTRASFTEELVYSYNHPFLDFIKWGIIFPIVACINLFLLCFYVVLSMVIGIFFTPYFIISGIVFLAKGRYRT